MITEAEVQSASAAFCAAIDALDTEPYKNHVGAYLQASLKIPVEASFLKDVCDAEGTPIPEMVERLFLFLAGFGGGGAAGLKKDLVSLELVPVKGVSA